MARTVSSSAIMQAYGITRHALHEWRKDGLPCKKIRGRWKYNPDAVEKWRREREHITGRKVGRRPGATAPKTPKAKKGRTPPATPPPAITDSLEASIAQLNESREAIFALVQEAIKNDDPAAASRLLTTLKDLIETLRKAEKDHLDLQEKRRILVSRDEAEGFCRGLCAKFRTALYQLVEELADLALDHVLNAGGSIEPKAQEAAILTLREATRDRFDRFLDTLSQSFREGAVGLHGD